MDEESFRVGVLDLVDDFTDSVDWICAGEDAFRSNNPHVCDWDTNMVRSEDHHDFLFLDAEIVEGDGKLFDAVEALEFREGIAGVNGVDPY